MVVYNLLLCKLCTQIYEGNVGDDWVFYCIGHLDGGGYVDVRADGEEAVESWC